MAFREALLGFFIVWEIWQFSWWVRPQINCSSQNFFFIFFSYLWRRGLLLTAPLYRARNSASNGVSWSSVGCLLCEEIWEFSWRVGPQITWGSQNFVFFLFFFIYEPAVGSDSTTEYSMKFCIEWRCAKLCGVSPWWRNLGIIAADATSNHLQFWKSFFSYFFFYLWHRGFVLTEPLNREEILHRVAFLEALRGVSLGEKFGNSRGGCDVKSLAVLNIFFLVLFFLFVAPGLRADRTTE